MSLAETVRHCLRAFDLEAHDTTPAVRSLINDELGRFRVWASNISAHRTGRRSLQNRLRDSSNLLSTAQSLLADLLAALDQLKSVLNASSTQVEFDSADALEGRSRAESVGSGNDHTEDTNEDDDGSLFELEDEDLAYDSPLEQAAGEVHEIINCLLRFSMALRNPARHDLTRQSATSSAVHFQPHYTDYVKTKYESAPDYLVRRLGKATSAHRQYFQYRENHHNKLGEGLDDDHEEASQSEKRPSTLASSLPNLGQLASTTLLSLIHI